MKHAVISDQNDYYRIVWTDGSRIDYLLTIQDIHTIMEYHDIDVLWTLPGCHFSQTIRREHFEELDEKHYSVYVPEHLVRNKVYGARVTSRIRGKHGEPAKDRFFMFPENREWKVPQQKDKGVWHVETAEDLLAIVHLLESEYGYCLWGPGYIGLEYLKGILRRQGKITVGLSYGLPTTQQEMYDKITRQMCHPVAWANLHTKGKYLHWLDKNGWYLGGAQSVELGNGNYETVVKMQKENSFKAAFYEYKLVEWDNSMLPCPLDKEGYAHVDLINAAHKAGAKLDVYGGIVWLVSQKYLKQWAMDMWEHRRKLSGGYDYKDSNPLAYLNAASTAKMIPNTMMGRLRNEGLAHWNDSIIHRAMANQTYTLQRLWRDEEIAPVLISKDALFFTSNDSCPLTAIPGMLEHSNEQRGYKCLGTCELTPEIEEAFSRVNDKRFGVNGLEAVIRKAMQQ